MKIAICTNFMDFNPGYSLTGIVSDQAVMLSKYGHEVHLFVCEQYNKEFDKHIPATIHHKVPFGHLKDYTSERELASEHKMFVKNITQFLINEFTNLKIDIAMTHDWIFTGWNLPFSIAMRNATPKLPNVRWLNWVHSVPSVNYDWWNGNRYGKSHKIIFPNATERVRVAEQFKCDSEMVRILPHIKDLRTWYGFDHETVRFLDDHPKVMQSEFVQVYPASTDRLSAKGVDRLATIFGHMKKRGNEVCLVVANQWATGRNRKEDVERYYRIAEKNGLIRDVDFIFTSEWDEQYATGISRRMLRELQLCANLFIFPTREESFGLVGPEAAFSGAFMVLNKSLSMMYEVFGNNGLYCDFGSHHNNFVPSDWNLYLREVAILILGRMYQNETIRTNSFCKRTYNYDAIYKNYYEPLFGESRLWL